MDPNIVVKPEEKLHGHFGKKIEEEYIETNMIMDEEDDKIVVSLCECSSEDDNAENDGKYCSDSDDY